MKELKIKLAERGLIQMGKQAFLIECLLNPQPSDYVRAPQTLTLQNAENTDYEDSQESGDESLVGFDDGDAADPLEEIEE